MIRERDLLSCNFIKDTIAKSYNSIEIAHNGIQSPSLEKLNKEKQPQATNNISPIALL